MSLTVIPTSDPVMLDIVGTSELFPVRRVYCVGRNYADHTIEMGGDPTRDAAFFFQKNADSLYHGNTFPYPPLSQDVHFEVELVVALCGGGADIPFEDALSKVYGYAVGIDFTRRDIQDVAKSKGRPWEAAKAFEKSAPVSPLVPSSKIGHPEKGAIWLAVNGVRKQSGNLSQLIWNVPEIISQLSRLFVLAPGDIIMSGTPAGVGSVVRGDQVDCAVEGINVLSLSVV